MKKIPVFKDPRDYQILFLSLFLLLGVLTRDFTVRLDAMLTVLAASLLTQAVADRIYAKLHPATESKFSLKSAWITGISLCLLLRSNSLPVMAMAGSVSILSKFIFRFRGKHFFNPSNFGIIAAIALTSSAWVSPGQWGQDAWYAFLFLAAGGMVVRKVGRWDTTGAFLLAYGGFEAWRNSWLGWTWDVFLNRMTSGALLLFAFFMITDPRAIPNNRRARIVWAVLVAILSYVLRNKFFMPTAILWALFILSPLTVLFDWIWPASRFTWEKKPTEETQCSFAPMSVPFQPRRNPMRNRRVILPMLMLTTSFALAGNLWSFCGFFVAKADAKLFNKASQVVIARDENRTVLTMVNDFQGEVKDFAIVVPVPVVLQKDQIHIGDNKIVERLDAFSAPRLVEYFDEDPCAPRPMPMPMSAVQEGAAKMDKRGGNALGVKIEAQFTVGEYDILILSAQESSGLEKWLIQNGYRIPAGAAELLQPYIKTNMKFFVAKVNLKEYEKTGNQFLRPIQMAFESPKFMLPIRLGMINSDGDQDLIVYVLSPKGRAEVANYRTVKIPSDMEIPLYVKNEFSDFYRAMFQRAYEKEGKNAVFVEYAWDMSWCDPCAADPLSNDELKKAGVFWLDETQNGTYITRLHVRYGRAKFPEDLTFQETPNRENYQGRFILRHPFTGEMKCEAGNTYKREVGKRLEKDAQTLANLTGWDINQIRKKMGINMSQKKEDDSWWQKIFSDDNKNN